MTKSVEEYQTPELEALFKQAVEEKNRRVEKILREELLKRKEAEAEQFLQQRVAANAPEKPKFMSVLEAIAPIPDAAQTLGRQFLGNAAAGISGSYVNKREGIDAGVDQVRRVQQHPFTATPAATQGGQQIIDGLGTVENAFMSPFRGAAQGAGDWIHGKMLGNPMTAPAASTVATGVSMLPDAAEAAAGGIGAMGLAASMPRRQPDIPQQPQGGGMMQQGPSGPPMSPLAPVMDQGMELAGSAARAGKELGQEIVPIKSKADKAAELNRGGAGIYDDGGVDGRLAKYDFDDNGRPKYNKSAANAIDHGWHDGLIQNIKDATPATRYKLLQAVRQRRRGEHDPLWQSDNYAADILGDSIRDRFTIVVRENKRAGKEIDVEAGKLKTEYVNYMPVIQKFADDLASELKVNLGRNEDGTPFIPMKADGKTPDIDYEGAAIEGSEGAVALLDKVFKRMATRNGVKRDKPMTAEDIHDLKRFIDEQVTYGKANSGKPLTGKAVHIVKNLRHNLDGLLDAKFDAYRQVNADYADTIRVINDYQKNVGSQVDLTGPRANASMGKGARVMASNYAKAEQTTDLLEQMDSLAKRFGGKFDDDIKLQAVLLNQMQGIIGPERARSFAGEVSSGVAEGIYTAVDPSLSNSGKVMAGLKKGFSRSEKKKQDARFDSIIKYIEGQGIAPFYDDSVRKANASTEIVPASGNGTDVGLY